MKKALQFLTVLVWILLLAFSGRTVAQETTASISGIVRDKSGPLAGVTIVAVHTPTGTQYSVSTRADGRFNISNVRISGPYRLTASFVGYRAQTLPPFGLTISQNFDANIVLTESDVQLKEVVVTTAQNKTFNSNHTGASDIISRSQIERLPTINRSLSDFTKLTPFANSNQTNSFGGRNNLYNNVTVNGSSFNNTFGLAGTIGGQTGAQPISIDAIDQIQVNLAPYDVRQGSFTGAGINTVTKSGTNNITGSAYGYYQSPGLKGSKVGDITYPVGSFNYHLLGFSFGAPIIKNKLFLFLDAETERRTSPATSFVAKQGAQAAGGNVSIADAATLDQLKNFLLTNYNYNPGTYQGYSYGFAADRITARLDYNINSRNTINFNFFYLKSNRDTYPSNSGAPTGGSSNTGRQPSINSLPFSGAGYNIINNLASGIIQLNSTISNSISNKVELGYTAMRDKRKSLGSGAFPLVDIRNGAGQPDLTAFGFEPFTANNLLNTDIVQLNDYLTISAGRHEIVLGTQNQMQSYKNGFDPNYNGAYVFNSATDFLKSATTGADLATQYQLGYSALSAAFPFAKVKNYQIGFFAQDKWRIKDNFNVTYGVRLDIPIFGETFSDNAAVHGLTFRDGLKESTSQKPKATIQVSPRIGFNWDVFKNQTLQVRGGTGLFTGPPPQVWISDQAGNNGVQFGAIRQSSSATKPAGFPFSPDVNKYRPTPGPNNLPHSYNLVFVDQHFKFPKVWRSDFGVDYKLPGDIIATVEGFYTKDVNAVNVQNINLPRQNTPLASVDKRPYFANSKIYGGLIPSSPTDYAAPNITDAELITNSKKGYSYAASLKLERNVKGLYTALIYTHSDSRSVNDGGSIAQSIWRDRAVSGDPNADLLSYSNYRLLNRGLGIVSYRKEYARAFATSIGVTYELQTNGAGTYTYSGDANNDGQSNDLIYVPRNASEINLQTYTVTNSITKVVTPYPAAQQWTDLNNYINQDPELKKRRGTYAERNGLVFPYYHQINLNFTQDFFFTLKNGKRNTLRFTADIYNFENLLNPKWGIEQIPLSTGSIIRFTGVDKNNVPSYSVNYLDPDNLKPYTRTFQQTGASAYAIQLGLKYIFQ